MKSTMFAGLRLVIALMATVTAFTHAARAADSTPVQPGAVPLLQQQAATRLPRPEEGMILGAARAGKRVVAVGDRGLVMLSDDDGKTYRQAKDVPTRATLTAVWAVDASTLWAVGHWGVMLVSRDAGETWVVKRSDIARDQPLLTVCFADAKHGVAAGLFSLLLVADDGATWHEVKLPAPTGGKKADLNLFQAFADKQGGLWIAAEQGTVYHSTDQGQNWSALSTGGKGTLWSGLASDDGSISVGGLQGKILRSVDKGNTWVLAETGTRSSITSLVSMPGGEILALALDGVSLVSKDGGIHFVSQPVVDQRAFTAAVVDAGGKTLLFSQTGVVRDRPRPE
jgi:photosystem II stability/assembly factor-like uncharacterized protein